MNRVSLCCNCASPWEGATVVVAEVAAAAAAAACWMAVSWFSLFFASRTGFSNWVFWLMWLQCTLLHVSKRETFWPAYRLTHTLTLKPGLCFCIVTTAWVWPGVPLGMGEPLNGERGRSHVVLLVLDGRVSDAVGDPHTRCHTYA